jgi:hypothetical protein
MTHEIQVSQYKTIPSNIKLGTFDSYGTEKLHFTFGSGWENLAVYATFTAPNGKSVQADVDIDGNTDVPPEATAEQAGQGEIVLIGKAEGVNRITVSLHYTVLEHGPVQGAEPAVPTPDLLQQVLTLSKDAQEAAKKAEQSAKNAVKDATDTVKPYKEETVWAAAAAALSQKSAAESKAAAQNAAELAELAGTAAGNAADDAEKAADIATGAAGNSAVNAENAQKSAQNAKQSAKDASESQRAAKASADAAAKSQQSAATDAKTANDSKVAAAGSAGAAAGAANAAENAASAAAGSEQAAGAAEERAAASERAAKESEQAAEKSALAALESKTAAAASEGNAAASAKKAKDIADSLPEDYTTAVNEIAALKTNKADQAELDTVKQRVTDSTPDDSIVGGKPWSSKHIIDMLCPPLEESGNPVVCYPVAGYPLGVKASWEPTQEGSGTPSPENIRPIKGRDSVTVERCGENLMDMAVVAESKNVTVDGDKIHVVDTSGWGQSYIIFDAKFPAGTYTIAFDSIIAKKGRVIVRPFNMDGEKADAKVTVAGDVYRVNANEYYKGYTFISNNIPSPQKIHFTVAKAAYFQVGFAGGLELGETEVDIINPTLVPGTTAPTAYTPYTGQTNTLTLPETVYGGEVDAVNGEGIKNWERVVLDGTEAWEYDTRGLFIYSLPQKAKSAAKLLCDRYTGKYVSTAEALYVENKIFVVGTSVCGHTTVSEWNAYLAAQYAAGTPVQICYQLAEPVPFTATGAQPIPALAGVNTVLTDADSATVTGRADPIKRITDLETSIASMT